MSASCVCSCSEVLQAQRRQLQPPPSRTHRTHLVLQHGSEGEGQQALYPPVGLGHQQLQAIMGVPAGRGEAESACCRPHRSRAALLAAGSAECHVMVAPGIAAAALLAQPMERHTVAAVAMSTWHIAVMLAAGHRFGPAAVQADSNLARTSPTRWSSTL